MKTLCYRCKGSAKILGAGYMEQTCPVCDGTRFADPEARTIAITSLSTSVIPPGSEPDGLADDEILFMAREIIKRRRVEALVKAREAKVIKKVDKPEKKKSE